LTMKLKLDTTGGSQQITGTVSVGSWTSQLVADRAVFSATNPCRYAGTYNFSWPGNPDSTNSPGGDSYGSVMVSPSGLMVGVIRLADGFTTTQTVPISKNGRWPLFGTLFGKELVTGWVQFTNGTLSGNIDWVKAAIPTGYYHGGFTNTGDNAASLIGSKWVAPAVGSGLNITLPQVSFLGGNLDPDLAPVVTYNSGTRTISSQNPAISMRLLPNIGMFDGQFVDPSSGLKRSISGVLLQKQNQARGFFLGTDQSGAVRLDNP
jgi:hypothetical protein